MDLNLMTSFSLTKTNLFGNKALTLLGKAEDFDLLSLFLCPIPLKLFVFIYLFIES